MERKGKLENYLKGLKDGLGIGIAYIPSGMTLGLISRNFGIESKLMTLMSLVLYAGSAQSLFLKAVNEKSTFIVILVSVFMINLRYALLNLIIYRELKYRTTLFEKILVGLGLTDETVAYIRIKGAKEPWYMIGINTLPYILFGLGSVAGSLFGNLIPDIFRNSMNFILYAAFLSLLITALKADFKYIRVVIAVIVFKILFAYTPVLNSINKGWSIILIMFLSSMGYALLYAGEGEGKNE